MKDHHFGFVGDGPSWRISNFPKPAGVTISQGTTRIVFPGPPVSSANPKPKKDIAHNTTFGQVYVNDIGRESMFSKEPQRFPVGSILVREKLSQPSAALPDVLVVMMKRAKGFNPKANDWEFLLISGDGKKIEKREKKGDCLGCHAAQSNEDYVFRNYRR